MKGLADTSRRICSKSEVDSIDQHTLNLLRNLLVLLLKFKQLAGNLLSTLLL